MIRLLDVWGGGHRAVVWTNDNGQQGYEVIEAGNVFGAVPW